MSPQQIVAVGARLLAAWLAACRAITVSAHNGDMSMVWLGVGAGVGLALGEATHHTALGLALGVALGAVIDVLLRRRRRQL